jgi:hypothetical protein
MMKKYLLGVIILILITPVLLFAQYKNNIWLLGYGTNFPAPYNGSKLTFYQDSMAISYDPKSMSFFACYSGLSAEDDSWFVYTNGSAVCNKYNDTLTNGNGLSPGGDDNWRNSGFPIYGMAVIIPAQNSGNLLYLFHENIENNPLPYYPNPVNNNPRVSTIYYSLVEPTAGMNGTVFLKNQVLFNDTAEIGTLYPCRHANGRDWWLLIKKYYSSEYYTYLITPNGVELKFIQTVPGFRSLIAGQQWFSPDGNYYVSFDNLSQLRIYDFDRCSGLLSNFKYKNITTNVAGGVSFSPNSRFLYISKPDTLWQFDMQSTDVLASQTFIAKYDGYVDSTLGVANAFWLHWLAPDGKIYINATSSSRVLHVINNPDELGSACNFQQHSLHFPTYNNGTTPTYVNLNLLQVPGSVCDSLGVGSNELQITNYELKIMPNPSDGRFSLEFKSQPINGMLYVYDVSGKEVYKEYVSPYSSIKNLDLSQKLNNGMYAVCLAFGNNISTQKVMIQK